ncbi:MAG: T9SS type A sorting domain-containing protein [Bacteroidia bacterium]
MRILTSFIFSLLITSGAFAACTPPVVTMQPHNAVVCANTDTSFTIAASGPSLNYQWQVDQGAGFINLANGGTYSGVTTATLVLTATPAGFNNYYYRCIVTNGCAPDDTSGVAILKVNIAQSIVLQPSDDIACEGSVASFGVVTSGTGLSYQWQVNSGAGFSDIIPGSPYSGDTTGTLYANAAMALNGYTYQCIISGNCSPPITTNVVTLSVNTATAITAAPPAAQVCEGNSVSIPVAAVGTGISFQWYVNTGSGYSALSNTSPYSGVTTGTLNISGAAASMNGYLYQCVVTGTCGNDSTMDIPLTVHPTFVNYISQTICQGDTLLFGASSLTAPGFYSSTFSSVHSCDSLVYLSLNVSPAYYSTASGIICAGDSLMINGAYQSAAGVYTYVLPTVSGCDSTIDFTLSLNPSYHFNQSTTICQGDSALIFGVYETADSTYMQSYTTYLGCDSIYAHTLIVAPNYIVNLSTNICQGDSALIGGSYESLPGSYSNTYATISGCDSIVVTVLAVHPLYYDVKAFSICSSDSIYLAGAWQNTAGTYTDSLHSVYGCDSVTVTTLSVNAAPIVTLNLLTYCADDPATPLTGGLPAGGTYSGPGVSANMFTPGSVITTYMITYTYTDSAGCSASATDGAQVALCDGIAEHSNDLNIEVYPNPFSSFITVSSDRDGILRIENVLGETIETRSMRKGRTEIPMDGLSSGLYLVRFDSGAHHTAKRIVKQ